MAIRLVRATEAHAEELVADLRDADRNEWVAGAGRPVRRMMLEAVRECAVCSAMVEDGRTLAIYGAAPAPEDGWGVAWMAATRYADRMARRVVLRAIRPAMAELGTAFPEGLVAAADARNTAHHAWMAWAGFEFDREVSAGPFGLPFYYFTRRTPCASRPPR